MRVASFFFLILRYFTSYFSCCLRLVSELLINQVWGHLQSHAPPLSQEFNRMCSKLPFSLSHLEALEFIAFTTKTPMEARLRTLLRVIQSHIQLRSLKTQYHLVHLQACLGISHSSKDVFLFSEQINAHPIS